MFRKLLYSFLISVVPLSGLQAQTLCHVFTAKGEPVDGAMLSFTPLSGSSTITTVTGAKGEAIIPDLTFPVVVTVRMMGFSSHTDTLEKGESPRIVLQPASASLGEVVVTGDYRAGYQSGSVHQVDVITRDEIERRGAVNVQDLLVQELNMRTSNDPAMGSSLNIQGTGGEHIKFLVDGVPLTGRKNGNIDLGQLNLNNIERVEVVKGPMSVLYGSDALGGVVNLITRKPQAGITSARINLYHETNGTYNADLSAGTSIGKTAVTLNGGRNYFDGWSARDTGRWQQWKPKEQYFGDLRLATKFKKTSVTLNSSWFREEVINKSEPVVTPYFATAIDQNYRTWRAVQQVQVSHQLGRNSVLQYSGAYSWYQYIKNTWRKDMVSLNEELTGDLSDDDTTRFKTVFSRAVYTWTPDSAAWTIMAGAELNHDNAIGQRIDGTEHTLTDIAAFASVDYRWRNLTIRPSARYNYNSRYDAPLVPALNVHLKTGNLTWRTGYSAGFRSPSLKELYLSFFDNGIHNVKGNPDLLAETSDNFTFSTEYRGKVKNTVLTLTLGAFYNAITDRITLVEKDASTGLYMYDNLDEFYARGGEFRARAGYKKFNVEAGFAYTGTDEVISGYELQPEIAWYPEFTAAADYTLNKYNTTLSVFWKNYGERPVYRYVDETPERFLNESFQMLDISVRQPLLKDKLQVTGGVKNLLDVTDVRASGSTGVHSGNTAAGGSSVAMGTTFFAKISYLFQ